jgi:DNA-binding LytR/AlgR family response regulator
MKVLIIEDEAPAFRRIQKILEEIDPAISIIDVIDTVSESVKWFNNHRMPDLIFMDIQLSDGLSFEIFDNVKVSAPVIFTTAFDEYMLRAFKVNSINYILKPIKKEDVAFSLQKYQGLKDAFNDGGRDINELIRGIKLDDKKFKSRYLVKQGDKFLSINTEDIAFFYAHNALVYLKTKEGRSHIMDYNLDELTQQLDPEMFIRANRQFILSFGSIKAVHKYHKGKLLVETFLPTEEPVTISAERVSSFKEWFGA